MPNNRAGTCSVRRLIPLVVLAAALSVLSPLSRPAAGQARSSTVVAMPEAFPDVEARSVLVRTPGLDVVLLRDGDDASDALLMAMVLLRKLRAEVGAPEPGSGQMIPITGFVITRDPTPAQRRRVDDAVRRVRAAEVSDLGSVGPARWIEYPGG